ncbi:MAG: hypothetical protein D6683_11145 [Actinomyces sp.]|nr:MAG: hypothetical protein D6683_11145 [Actinomyces sp.]
MRHDVGPPCECADGSPYAYWTRDGDPTRVVLYFQGGGACFSAETCSFTDGTYDVNVTDEDDPSGAGGIFDATDPRNPVAGWSFVYVPYCTGDVFLGDAVHEYAPDLVVHHKGFVDANHGLTHLLEHYPDAEKVFVTGSSAGAIPSPLFGAFVADALPDADVAVLGDAAGAYPDNPVVNTAIGGLWNTFANVPDWPENADLTPADWSIPGLYRQAGLHAPRVRFARYDNAYDEVQAGFVALSGLADATVLDLVETTEAAIEEAGVPLSSYIAPGTRHTILWRPEFYDLTVEGVPFVDWVTDLIDGERPTDVHCTDCGAPPA